MEPAFSLEDIYKQQTEPQKDPFVNLLWIVGVVATVIIVIVIFLIALYLFKKYQPITVRTDSQV